MKNILDRPQVLFLIFCTFWSLLFAFFNPPFQAPDEPEHLYKIYGISQGSWSFKKLTQPIYENGEYIGTVTKSGNIFPNGLIDASLVTYDLHFSPYKKTSFQETREIAKIKLQKETQYFMNYGVPAYTPISYMPSVIFVWLLSLFNATPFVILMVARLCSLFTYLIFGYYAIKITPIKKWLFLIFALMPMCLYEASACSTDALIMGASLLFTAYTLNLAYNEKIEKITFKHNLVFLLLASIIAICKFTYMPLVFLYLIIPNKKFTSAELKLKNFVLYTIFTCALSVLVIAQHLYFSRDCQFGSDAFSSKDLFLNAIFYPIDYFIKVILSTFENFYGYLSGFIGIFGWLDAKLPEIVVFIYFGLLILTAVQNNEIETVKISLKDKLIFFLISAVSYFLVLSSCYLVFGETIYGILLGVQGRYFIPFALVALLMFSPKKGIGYGNVFKIISLVVVNFVLFVSLLTIICRFYIL